MASFLPGDLIQFRWQRSAGIFTCPFSTLMPNPPTLTGSLVGRTLGPGLVAMVIIASVPNERVRIGRDPRIELFVKVLSSPWEGSRWGWIPNDHIGILDSHKIA